MDAGAVDVGLNMNGDGVGGFPTADAFIPRAAAGATGGTSDVVGLMNSSNSLRLVLVMADTSEVRPHPPVVGLVLVLAVCNGADKAALLLLPPC